MSRTFAEKYGPWAVVAGASEGLGAEFANKLAAQGLNVLLIARRAAALDEVAASLRARHSVAVRTAALDLSDFELAPKLQAATADIEVGLFVYNAAHSTIGEFLSGRLDDALRTLDVNCRGPIIFGHVLGQKMAARGRGGIVLMTSMSANQGTPLIATYAATKAWNVVFAEGLWEELGRHGVDVVACQAGAVRTPNYARSKPRGGELLLADPALVAAAALRSLGRGPVVIPGLLNQVSAFLLRRLLPRRVGLHIMSRTVRGMYER